MANLDYDVDDFAKILERPSFQFCAYIPPEKDAWLQSIMTGCIITRWCDYFCDVIPASSSKPKGVRVTLERHGLRQEESIAFGDGGNDATMLAYAGIGVAMGNATKEAKDAADYTTTNVGDDGIANALRHFGLIN